MKRFQELFLNHQKIFIPYFMLGFPTVDQSLKLITSAIDAGVLALELGMPFSDPIADGTTIQTASACALANGMNFQLALELIQEIRHYSAIPLAFMTYYNIIFRPDPELNLARLKEAGIDAILAVDRLPDHEDYLSLLAKADLDSIFLIAPNTPAKRREFIAEKSTAFVYLVSVKGTTGAREHLDPASLELLTAVKSQTTKPVVVGFGISQPLHSQMLYQQGANGTIVASKLIELIQQAPTSTAQVTDFIHTMI
ncbi:MAG: tryptophan synthase subunit alpha [Legionellales bacterium]|nr:tryptophan synthase subunit alpha [Legionellales bacterium]